MYFFNYPNNLCKKETTAIRLGKKETTTAIRLGNEKRRSQKHCVTTSQICDPFGGQYIFRKTIFLLPVSHENLKL